LILDIAFLISIPAALDLYNHTRDTGFTFFVWTERFNVYIRLLAAGHLDFSVKHDASACQGRSKMDS
jgi:hypothetical protein